MQEETINSGVHVQGRSSGRDTVVDFPYIFFLELEKMQTQRLEKVRKELEETYKELAKVIKKELQKENYKVGSNSKAERTSDHERNWLKEEVYKGLDGEHSESDPKYKNNMEKIEELKASHNAEKKEWEQRYKMLACECKERNKELAKELAKLKLEYKKDHEVLTEKMSKYEESSKCSKLDEIRADYLRELYAHRLKHAEIQNSNSREIYSDYLREFYARTLPSKRV